MIKNNDYIDKKTKSICFNLDDARDIYDIYIKLVDVYFKDKVKNLFDALWLQNVNKSNILTKEDQLIDLDFTTFIWKRNINKKDISWQIMTHDVIKMALKTLVKGPKPKELFDEFNKFYDEWYSKLRYKKNRW